VLPASGIRLRGTGARGSVTRPSGALSILENDRTITSTDYYAYHALRELTPLPLRGRSYPRLCRARERKAPE